MAAEKSLSLPYEGKAKIVRAHGDGSEVEVHFKDDATAFDGTKKDRIEDKGRLNARISALLFEHLERAGVKTHFIRRLDERTLLTRRLTMLPLEVVVRNVAAGSLVRRLGFQEGIRLDPALVEFYLKDDRLHDPLVNDDHVRALDLADASTMEQLRQTARRVNQVLQDFFLAAGLLLVDFKLEFGRSGEGGQILLGDEVSPDTCRLWDVKTGEKLDKDRFRFDLGDLRAGYSEVLTRIERQGP